MAVDGANTLFVNVHVGGIVRCDDTGPSPTLDIHADVHQVIADPSVEEECWRLAPRPGSVDRRTGLHLPRRRSSRALLPGGDAHWRHRADLRIDRATFNPGPALPVRSDERAIRALS